MSNAAKTRILKYGICAVFTVVLAWLYIALRDFEGAVLVEKYRMLCDAFTVPGVLLLCVGGLVWASNLGALDGLSYVVSVAVKALIPGKRKEIEKYGDYVLRKREKPPVGCGFLLISGAVVMAIAMVFLALFYSLYQ